LIKDGSVKILGVDPGSRITGYGVIEVRGQQQHYLTAGTIRLDHGELADRLKTIFLRLSEVIAEFAPAELAIEKVFVQRNVDSALKLGQARGAAICAAALRDLPVYEYAPNQIKLAVVGRGHAEKAQVQHMVTMLLGLSAKPVSDAADALACAICHSNLRRSQLLIAERARAPAPRGVGAR